MALMLDNVALHLHGKRLFQPFSLAIPAGGIVTLMGPSGSGKSSLLSFIAGDLGPPFEAEGSVSLNGLPLAGLPPEVRGIGRLFQDDLLFPHMTVAENLMFGIPRGPRAAREAQMNEGLRDIGLNDFASRPPHTLSGGQRARVALMRALLARPGAMLLDEPFNKLDAALRATMREFVFAHLRGRGMPCLLVTHDPADAPAGGRIIAIRPDGRIADA